MRKLFTLCLLIVSLSASAQWQQTGSKVRYVNGLGIPTRDTAAGVLADSSQIVIRPADSALYVKYKRTWLRVGGGGGSIAGSGTTNYIPKFTSSTAIGNSQIFDNGTGVGIGTTSPGSILEIAQSTPIFTLNASTSTGLHGIEWKNSGVLDAFIKQQPNTAEMRFSNGRNGSWGGFMTFYTDVSERMRITSTGNVGIGTASPSEKLHLVGNTFRQNDASNSFGYTISTTSATTILSTIFGGSSFGIRTGGSGSDNMRITSAGDVGIGTVSPATRLHLLGAGTEMRIESNTSSDGFIRYINTSGSMSFGMSGAPTNTMLLYDRTNNHNAYEYLGGASGRHSWYTTNVERMRITSAGDVGIGTTSPATYGNGGLVLGTTSSGKSILLYSSSNGNNGVIGFKDLNNADAYQIAAGTNSVTFYGYGSRTMEFYTNGTERMRITSAGDVGIGTTSPNSRLDVDKGSQSAGGTTPSGALLIANRTAGNGILELGVSASAIGWLQSRNSTSATYYPLSLNPSAGNVLINTATDNGTDKLQVSGSASVTSLLGVGTSPSAGTVHIKTTSPSIVLDDNDNAGTAAIRFRPQSASFATRGSIELVSTGSAAPTRFVIASTDTMTFRTNNVERMRITSAGGNVLISKTTDNGIDKLQVNGSIDAKGFAQAYTTKGATYTAATSDYLIDCTSGTFTVNLPDALLNVGRILVIKNSGTGTITVDGFSTQTIDGATTYSLSAQWATVQIMCDGSNWKIISKF